MEQFFVNAENMTAVEAVPEGATGKFAVVSKPEHLMELFNGVSLKTLIGTVRGKELKGDETKSQKKLAFEIFKLMTDPKAKKAEKVKADKKPTKVSLAREIFEKQTTIKKADLAAAVGHDLTNCHTMISILKNSARTKNHMLIAYNKKTTEYTLCPTVADLKALEDKFVKAEADAVAQDANEKEAKKKTAADKKAAADKEKATKKAAADKEKADKKAAAKKETPKAGDK